MITLRRDDSDHDRPQRIAYPYLPPTFQVEPKPVKYPRRNGRVPMLAAGTCGRVTSDFSGGPAALQGAADGRTFAPEPIVSARPSRPRFFADFSAEGDESFEAQPSNGPKAWSGATQAPLWNGDSIAGDPTWTRAPATNPPEYDSSTAIRAGWTSTLVQDSDNFLLAPADDVTFQDFQTSFFR